ncbi:MAG: hypothetical protein WCQ21_11415 [Verrucomicrobiota bacterium]
MGTRAGLIFDAALMDLAHLKVGDQSDVTVHEGGAIVLTPVRRTIEPQRAAATARRLIRKNCGLFNLERAVQTR